MPERRSSTPTARHRRLVERAVDRYRARITDHLVYALQNGGEIPGIGSLSEARLRRFFQTETSPEYWAQLAAINPNEAVEQLAQWERVDRAGARAGREEDDAMRSMLPAAYA